MIAFDTAQTLRGTFGTSWSHTCSGTNRLLLVWITSGNYQNNTDPSTVTYNGVAMTQIAKLNWLSNSSRCVWLYALKNPAVGANNVVVSFGGSQMMCGCSASYNGCNQTTNPEAVATSTNGGNNTQSLALSITTLTDNAWIVGGAWWFGGQNYSVSAGGGTIRTQYTGETNDPAMYDSNGVVTPAGAKSLTINVTSSSNQVQMINVSIAPALMTGLLASNLAMMGIGS